jgi:outer membrane receptor protein involved in Fe transport
MNILARFLAFFSITLFFPGVLLAQKGTIRGSVFDDASGEPLIGVTVKLMDLTIGGTTDIDGKFSISVQPGTYSVVFSYISYQLVTVSEVMVTEDQVTLLENIRLKEEQQTLEEVVITAEAIRDNESAILTVKKKAANVMDGISSVKFRQIGDSDASEAVKRVTGVSVEGGRYVFVRGLGDRYTKTTLNSVDIPGLDPDRNSIQIDIFPTNLIDNMMVLKSSVAELPADFTGGVVNIETKDFPDYKVFNISAGVTYNPSMHFNNSYFTYNGGKTDWLGIDDGTRELPSLAENDPFLSAPPAPGVSPDQVNTFLKQFNKTLSTKNQTSLMDFDLGLSTANQYNFSNGNSLGYIFSLTYKNSTVYYDDVIFGEYQRPAFPDEYELVYATVQTGEVTERHALLGVLGGVAFKTKQSKYKLTGMHLQNGEKRAAQFFIDDNGSAVGKSGFFGGSENLEFSQRGVSNLLLSGDHTIRDKKISLNWKVSPTFSNIEEPDIRKTAFTYTDSDTVFNAGAAGNPTRIWRYLNEINVVGRVDLSLDYTLFGEPNVFKVGSSYVFKERDYKILTYDLQFLGLQPDFNGDASIVLEDQYLYPTGPVYYSSGNPTPNPNQYNSNVNNIAFYFSNQFQFFTYLKAIVGLRAENYVQRHTGRAQDPAQGSLDNDIVLDGLKLFPSLNLVYALRDNQNLRASYSRTIARPSFKELSFAQILDPVSNRIFNGGLFKYSDWDGNLQETLIDNIDLRWEVYPTKDEIFSVSFFYKNFEKPIELVRIPQAQTTNEFQPRNVGNGMVLGAELEFKQSLRLINPRLKNVYFSGNITVVESSIEMTSTEFNARKGYEKEGETIEDTRQMAGQAPYMINAGISYENANGIDGGLFYNVNGPTLTVVGGGLFPDVYSEPFHSLNFNINKSFGKDRRTLVTFNVSNILNDKRENFFTGYNADRQYYSRFNPGTSFKIGLKYQL